MKLTTDTTVVYDGTLGCGPLTIQGDFDPESGAFIVNIVDDAETATAAEGLGRIRYTTQALGVHELTALSQWFARRADDLKVYKDVVDP